MRSPKIKLNLLISCLFILIQCITFGSNVTYADSLSLTLLYPGGLGPDTRYPDNVQQFSERYDATPVALTSDGRVYIPGSGYIPDFSDVVKVFASESSGFAIKSDGTLWSWGDGSMLGRNHDIDNDGYNDADSVPGEVTGLPAINDIELGSGFVLALDNDGNVWSWGDNRWGSLGIDQNCPSPQNLPPSLNSACTILYNALPTKIAGLSNVQSIAAGPT